MTGGRAAHLVFPDFTDTLPSPLSYFERTVPKSLDVG